MLLPHCYHQQWAPQIQFPISSLLGVSLHSSWTRAGPWEKAEPVTQRHFSISNEPSLHSTSPSIPQEVFSAMTSSKIPQEINFPKVLTLIDFTSLGRGALDMLEGYEELLINFELCIKALLGKFWSDVSVLHGILIQQVALKRQPALRKIYLF